MVAKKTEKANLENKRILYFEAGMVLVLAAALVVIEWSHTKAQNPYMSYTGNTLFEEELDIPISRTDLKKEIKPPELPKIEIVKDITDIPEEDFDFNVESNWDDIVDFVFIEPDEEKPEELGFVWFAEKMPQYHNGGLENFHKFIQQIVNYPQAAIENGLQGRVFVKFIVDKKGYVTGIEIQQGIHPLLDNAVIAAIQKSDRWQPGKQGGMPVNVAMSMPVVFRLQ